MSMTKWRQMKRLATDCLTAISKYKIEYFILFESTSNSYNAFCKVTDFKGCVEAIKSTDFNIKSNNRELCLNYKTPISSQAVRLFRRNSQLVKMGNGIYQVLSLDEAKEIENEKALRKRCRNCEKFHLIKYVGYRCKLEEGIFQKVPSHEYCCSLFVNKKA